MCVLSESINDIIHLLLNLLFAFGVQEVYTSSFMLETEGIIECFLSRLAVNVRERFTGYITSIKSDIRII